MTPLACTVWKMSATPRVRSVCTCTVPLSRPARPLTSGRGTGTLSRWPSGANLARGLHLKPHSHKRTTKGHQWRLQVMKKVVFKMTMLYLIQKKLLGKQNVGLLWFSNPFKKIRSGQVEKDSAVIGMALSLPTVSLANTDEHRTNAWIGTESAFCLLGLRRPFSNSNILA